LFLRERGLGQAHELQDLGAFQNELGTVIPTIAQDDDQPGGIFLELGQETIYRPGTQSE